MSLYAEVQLSIVPRVDKKIEEINQLPKFNPTFYSFDSTVMNEYLTRNNMKPPPSAHPVASLILVAGMISDICSIWVI